MIDGGMNKENWRNDDNRGKLQYFEESLSHSHLTQQIPKRPGQELSPYLRGERRGRIKCQMMRNAHDGRGEGGSLFNVLKPSGFFTYHLV